MSERLANGTVSFGEKLATSQVFAALFRDGMALVEETAAYLDGPGRQESKRLERNGALAYATESMRLTTRLMQLEHNDEHNLKLVPERLRTLVHRSKELQRAVRRLDVTMHAAPARVERGNPVERQMGLLRAAFEQR
jgi:regulator of CtrA degradation